MIKYILISLLFVSLYFDVSSQDYYPFPTENANWNIFLEYSISEGPLDSTVLRYSLNGDTTINQIAYKRLCLESGNIEDPIITPVGGLREVDKKIYFIGNDYLGMEHATELLLYDFNLQIGDTIKHDNRERYSIITDIDSVEVDGELRKRYEINSRSDYPNKEQEYWIEGIGSIKNGLLGLITDVPTCCYHFWEHVCFKENGIVKFLNPSFSECLPENLLSSTENSFQISNIRIYPNPVKNELFIDVLSLKNELFLRLVDNNGKIVLQKQIKSKNSRIKMIEKTGIYYLIINDLTGEIIRTEKILVQ